MDVASITAPTRKFLYYALMEYSSYERFQHTILGRIDVSGFLVKEKAINIPRMHYQSMHVLVIHNVPLPRLCVPALLGSECWPAVPADSYRPLGHLTTISCSNWTDNSTVQSLSNQFDSYHTLLNGSNYKCEWVEYTCLLLVLRIFLRVLWFSLALLKKSTLQTIWSGTHGQYFVQKITATNVFEKGTAIDVLHFGLYLKTLHSSFHIPRQINLPAK